MTDRELLETETVRSDVEYEIDPDGIEISDAVYVYRELGDSDFEYVLVGHNVDDGSKHVAFGFHEPELPLSTPEDS